MERMQYHWNIHLKVLYMHLHNSLAHLACYPLPRNNRCQQSSATVNVISDQLMIKSSPSSSAVPPNSSFVAADAASNAARSNLQSLASVDSWPGVNPCRSCWLVGQEKKMLLVGQITRSDWHIFVTAVALWLVLQDSHNKKLLSYLKTKTTSCQLWRISEDRKYKSLKLFDIHLLQAVVKWLYWLKCSASAQHFSSAP